jgi:hypothetical protein
VAPERDDHRLLGLCQRCGPQFRRPGLHIRNSRPLPPLRHRLRIDTEFAAQLRGRSLRSLHCCSDGVPSPWCSNQWRTTARSWRSRDERVPKCFLPFLRKDRTIKPWDQTCVREPAQVPQSTLHGLEPWDKNGGPGDQRGRLIGHTKGGMNTKLHAVTDARGRPIRFFMAAGQVSDCTGARALLSSLPTADWLLGDRGYDAD